MRFILIMVAMLSLVFANEVQVKDNMPRVPGEKLKKSASFYKFTKEELAEEKAAAILIGKGDEDKIAKANKEKIAKEGSNENN